MFDTVKNIAYRRYTQLQHAGPDEPGIEADSCSDLGGL